MPNIYPVISLPLFAGGLTPLTIQNSLNKAIRFNGIDDYGYTIEDTLFDALAFNTQFTVNFWVKQVPAPSNNNHYWYSIVSTDGVTNVIRLRTEVGTNKVVLTMFNTADLKSTGTFPNGNWIMVTVARTATSALLYVNGVLQGTRSFTLPATFITEQFFAYNLAAKLYASCNMDEFSIWGTQLTVAAILTLYNGGVPLAHTLLPLQANLKIHYRMGENMIMPVMYNVKNPAFQPVIFSNLDVYNIVNR